MARVEPSRGDRLSEEGLETGERSRFFGREQALWERFAKATTPETYCASWLALQCAMVKGVSAGVVLLGAAAENQPFTPVAFWPNAQHNLKHLAEVAERALQERRCLILKRTAQSDSGAASRERYDIAYPITVANRICAVVALDVDPRPQAQLADVMRQLQWGAAWMEVLFHRGKRLEDSAPQERLQAVVDTMATIAGQERFQGAAVAFVTALATRLECDRVSLGFVRDGRVRVQALSHSAQFGKDTNLIHAIGNAMDEAFDQQAVVVYPGFTDARAQLTRAHAELARQYGNGAICSIPLSAHGQIVGVLTVERPAERPIAQGMVELCEAIAALAGPVLEVQRRDDRWLLGKVVDASRTQLEHLIGPGHIALKLAVFGVAALLLFFIFVKGDYRVTAKTVIEPAVRRAVVVAFNGYIAEAPARAGDLIRKGQLLARLDDRELRLERSKWLSQQEQSVKQYYEALGTRNAAQVQILTAQIDQAKAQVALIEDQLARTQVVAPFDGVVVTGDLSQSLGAPVERGQVLFEVAPLDAYRIILQVDERDIADVKVAQHGDLVLSGFPNEPLPLVVEKLTPVSTASEGRNYFRVEAKLKNVPERLRPGMEGVGKIEIDRRRLIWIWTHEITDRLRLKLWQWMP
jgi:RND family efflux transporter MFP subunit